ncbi:MAG: phosphotransferase family protein [Acidimicrobiales bacterium]
MSEVPQGIDSTGVTSWFETNVGDLAGPLSFELIAGGHSNLTFFVHDTAAANSWVLRRPPLGNVLATAHDMGREHRIMGALAHCEVPVPAMIGYCEDLSVNDAPFYVMEVVEGHVIRNITDAGLITVAARSTASKSLAHVLASLHNVDVDAVGLANLAKHDGYIERQLRRWLRQFHAAKTSELPAIDKVHELLSSSMPDQQGVGIVHGDYRLDNCIVDDDGHVKAVLDWELCTLGDVMADIGLLMVYWAEPDDDVLALEGIATVAEGFATRDQVIDWYGAASGRDVSNIEYYIAFANWRLACILEGVYARYLAGAMGDKVPDELSSYRPRIESLVNEALRLAKGLHV